MTTNAKDILTCKKYTCEEAGAVFKRSGVTIKRWIEEGKYFDLDHIIKLDDGYLIPEYELRRTVESLMDRDCPDKTPPPASNGKPKPTSKKRKPSFKDDF